MEIDGFYRAFFTGNQGNGFLIFAIIGEKIAGLDATGGVLRGTVKRANTNVAVNAELELPKDTTLATDGRIVGSDGLKLSIRFETDETLGAGKPVRIETETGPINVIFQHMLGL